MSKERENNGAILQDYIEQKKELSKIIETFKGLLAYQMTCLESVSNIQMDTLDARPIVIKKVNDFTKNQRKIAEDLQFQISTYYATYEHNSLLDDEFSGVQLEHPLKITKEKDCVRLLIPELPPKRYYHSTQDSFLQEYEPRSLLRKRLDNMFLKQCSDTLYRYRMYKGRVEVRYIFHIRENTIRDVDGFDIKVIQDVITEYLLKDDNYMMVTIVLEGQEIKNSELSSDEYTEVLIRYI